MIFHSTEFYYTDSNNISDSEILLTKDESNHATTVMRNAIDDIINITDGKGNIYKSRIYKISKFETRLKIESKSFKERKYINYNFLLPILKSNDRLEFAIEKSVELGITNFTIFVSDNSYKKGIKLERLNKIALAAMKQSLQVYKPSLSLYESLYKIPQNNELFIIFDQRATERLNPKNIDSSSKMNLIFGPEAGLSSKEIDFLKVKKIMNLSEYRLRSETAIITAASILTLLSK